MWVVPPGSATFSAMVVWSPPFQAGSNRVTPSGAAVTDADAIVTSVGYPMLSVSV